MGSVDNLQMTGGSKNNNEDFVNQIDKLKKSSNDSKKLMARVDFLEQENKKIKEQMSSSSVVNIVEFPKSSTPISQPRGAPDRVDLPFRTPTPPKKPSKDKPTTASDFSPNEKCASDDERNASINNILNILDDIDEDDQKSSKISMGKKIELNKKINDDPFNHDEVFSGSKKPSK